MSNATGYLNIPANVKQYYLPFVLDKENTLNSELGYCQGFKQTASTQVFSFRPSIFNSKDGSSYESESAGFIRIAPKAFYDYGIDEDISLKTLYEYQEQETDTEELSYLKYSSSIDHKQILDFTPCITIREYLQESKLNMVTDFLKNGFSMLQEGFSAGSKLAESLKNSDNKAKILKLAFEKFDFKDRFFSEFQSIIDDAAKSVLNASYNYITENRSENKNYSALKNESTKNSEIYNQTDNSIMMFPYAVYYMIIASATTNIYEIPYSGKMVCASQGGGFSKETFGGLDNKGESLLGQAINWFGKNLKVNINPTWDGPQDTPTKIDIEFTLYNDDVDGALKNFIFINTIVPGNKWLQYHIFQHAPNLYDVKINGIDRLFMCQGDFTVDYAGQLRVPSSRFISKLTTNHSYIYDKFGSHYFSSHDNIRIPDQYNIKMTFTSLLPNNFNNYMYSYWYNTPIRKLTGPDIYSPSIAGQFLSKSGEAMKKIADDFQKTVVLAATAVNADAEIAKRQQQNEERRNNANT